MIPDDQQILIITFMLVKYFLFYDETTNLFSNA